MTQLKAGDTVTIYNEWFDACIGRFELVRPATPDDMGKFEVINGYNPREGHWIVRKLKNDIHFDPDVNLFLANEYDIKVIKEA